MENQAELYDKHGVYTELAVLLKHRAWAQRLKLFSRQAARSMLLGETRSRFRGRGMEFEEVRLYQPGDDIRNIDWRVSARTGGTYTKLFCEERERPVHILVDQRNSLFFGSTMQFKSVLAAEIAAAIAWAALAGSDRIGGQIIGEVHESDIRARRNKQAVLHFIHDLNKLNRALPAAQNSTQAGSTAIGQDISTRSIAQSLEECKRLTRPGTAIFVISDFHDFDEPAVRALSNLGRHADISLIHVVDTLEEKMPLQGTFSISDGEKRISVQLDPNLREAYLHQIDTRLELLQRAASRARALYARVDTSQSARTFLNGIFAK